MILSLKPVTNCLSLPLYSFISIDFEPLCSHANNTCHEEIQNVLDPRKFGLTEDFIFIEHEWGSMFYKYIGKQTRAEAKRLCSAYGDSVHLPIPRFQEENEFYRKHFVNDTLWLDISKMPDCQYKSSHGQLFLRPVKTFLDLEYVKNYDWINMANFGSKFVILTADGQWKTTDELNQRDSVCVYNLLPHENCSNCPDAAFCRFTNETRQETECVCSIGKKGKFCENDLCSHCQNGRYCRHHDEESDQFHCICPKPFCGENCSSSKNFIALFHYTYIINRAQQLEYFSGINRSKLTIADEIAENCAITIGGYTYAVNTWGNSVYKTYEEMNYHDAKDQCEVDGAYLATPRSNEENAFIASLIPNANIWIGLNDIDEEGTFVSVDGEDVTYKKWSNGEPNDSGNEDGVEIIGDRELSNGYWNDKSTKIQNQFVCMSNIIFDYSGKF